jgi:hypothetical protein
MFDDCVLNKDTGIILRQLKCAIALLQVCGYEEKSNLWPHGYVLKVMNSLDSQKLSLLEAQTETVLYLGKILVTLQLLVALST